MIRGRAGAEERVSVPSEEMSLRSRARDGNSTNTKCGTRVPSGSSGPAGLSHTSHFTMSDDDDNKPFVSLAKLQLPVSSRLLPSACCPDKDLVITISPQNGKDHVSLWKMQGSKKWEVDVRSDSARNETIVDLAWSPDGVLS